MEVKRNRVDVQFGNVDGFWRGESRILRPLEQSITKDHVDMLLSSILCQSNRLSAECGAECCKGRRLFIHSICLARSTEQDLWVVARRSSYDGAKSVFSDLSQDVTREDASSGDRPEALTNRGALDHESCRVVYTAEGSSEHVYRSLRLHGRCFLSPDMENELANQRSLYIHMTTTMLCP